VTFNGNKSLISTQNQVTLGAGFNMSFTSTNKNFKDHNLTEINDAKQVSTKKKGNGENCTPKKIIDDNSSPY
jgi:hypothetical protein